MKKVGPDSWGALVIVAVVLVVALIGDGEVPRPSSSADAGGAEPAGFFSATQPERFQPALATLVVGLVGFAGVILTLFVNARIGRHDFASGCEKGGCRPSGTPIVRSLSPSTHIPAHKKKFPQKKLAVAVTGHR